MCGEGLRGEEERERQNRACVMEEDKNRRYVSAAGSSLILVLTRYYECFDVSLPCMIRRIQFSCVSLSLSLLCALLSDVTGAAPVN